jgi:thiamine biosynthesis lipoprotein ApbE
LSNIISNRMMNLSLVAQPITQRRNHRYKLCIGTYKKNVARQKSKSVRKQIKRAIDEQNRTSSIKRKPESYFDEKHKSKRLVKKTLTSA